MTLNKLWWSAVPADGVLDLATLPVRDGRLLTLNQFHDRLRKLNTEHPELQIQVRPHPDASGRSSSTTLGIDTALYRYQARMNTSEGGIAKVFNFNTVRDFIDLVVDVIAAPEQAADCGNVVNQHAQEPVPAPELLTERAFLTEARNLLGRARRGPRAGAAPPSRTATTPRAMRSGCGSRSPHAARSHETARCAPTRPGRGLPAARDRSPHRTRPGRRRPRRAASSWPPRPNTSQAGEDVERAVQDEGGARVDHAAWAAAAPLAEAAGHDATAGELREQLQPERAARRELRATPRRVRPRGARAPARAGRRPGLEATRRPRPGRA